jgi:Tol biopolymer transport system component
LSWGADGNLLVSNSGRLFKLGANGKNQTQLLADSSAMMFSSSSCGTNYLVLSWQHIHSGQNIWRTNVDGSNPLKLTGGNLDDGPVCSPDQKWVYYVDGSDSRILRVPLDGAGKTEPVFGHPQVYIDGRVSVSFDGRTLAAPFTQEGATKIALLNLESPSSPRMLDASHMSGSRFGGYVQFAPDGKSLAYAIREDGVDNIWIQPLDGSSRHQLTHFNAEQIWAFHLSPDGKSLAVLRGHYDSDVVLLQESKP